MNAADTGQSDSASMAQTIYTEDRSVACDGGGGALGLSDEEALLNMSGYI